MPARDRTRSSDPSVLDRTPRAEPLGESETFIEFNEHLSRVAKVDRPVLIVGERGTGKELAVHRLHYLSGRWQGPLVALNCAALSPSVLESELFGHEAGAFTGAMRRRQGRFEAAEGGTLFLDEIGLIPVQVQEKILRVVEYREFERVGGSEPVRVDVRIVGATNANLPAMAREGRFKADLLDRLSFEVLYLPPLRRRPEDILLLARHFLARMAMELGREPPELSARAERQLEAHAWPGNIRELKNAVERAVYRCTGTVIKEIDFDPFGRVEWSGAQAASPHSRDPVPESARAESPAVPESTAPASPVETPFTPGGGESLAEALRRFERKALREALEAARYHQGEAAKRLGLTYHQFRGLFRKYKDEFPS